MSRATAPRPMLLTAPQTYLPAVGPLPRWKRTMDIVLASVALILLSPVIAAIAVAIRLDSRGAAFFAQERVGNNGVPFTCWKFRSMCVDAEMQLAQLQLQNEARGAIFKMKDDPRRTRVGKFLRKTSLDEVPQFWNVLVGEMSLVGPRPPLPHEVATYEPEQWSRLRGVPGITGLWQVRARHRQDFLEMCQLDVEYLEDIRMHKDLAILLRTIPAVVTGRGAH
jgi:lipopolysaccharide/colanic/teichoic acid biosynthesis glycosyltransferase